MTQSNTIRTSYTRATMDSTDVYNYLKRLARKTSSRLYRDNIDCLAEALICTYGDNVDIDTNELKKIVICPDRLTTMDYREMECHVTTSLSVVPVSEVAA